MKYNSTPVTRIQSLIEQAIDRNTLPGAVVLVTLGGRTVYQEAFGLADRETKRPQGIDDVFFLGSTSKPLATAAILTLVDKGSLELFNPASIWFPEFNQAALKSRKRVRSPVIGELLSHTSGIFGNTTATKQQKQLLWNFNRDLATVATQLCGQAFFCPPGEKFCYGGASMTLAGRIAELITKKEFDKFATGAVFSQLGMHDTFYRSGTNYRDRFSVLYTHSAGNMQKARFQPRYKPGCLVLPPGGIISTAQDLSRFLRLHLDDPVHRSARILSSELITVMRTDTTDGKPMDIRTNIDVQDHERELRNEGYGLGWILRDIDEDRRARVFFHGGAFGTLIWGDVTTGLGIVLLTHTPFAQVARLWDDVISTIREIWGNTGA